MKLLKSAPVKFTAALALTALVFGSALQSFSLAKTLVNLEQPIAVELKSGLNSKTTAKGERFEAVSKEDYNYLGGVIPSGTTFKGHVEEAKCSRVFARPGYVVLKVDEAVYPTGEVYKISTTPTRETNSPKIQHPKAKTFGKNVMENTPFVAVSTATSVPLTVASNMSGALIFPIALGARMITGAAGEVISKDDQGRNLPAQVGYGMWRGTGIPGTIGFLKKPQELELKPGDTVNLQLDPTTLKSLFLVKNQEDSPQAEATPEGPQSNTTGLVPEVKQPESAQSQQTPNQ